VRRLIWWLRHRNKKMRFPNGIPRVVTSLDVLAPKKQSRPFADLAVKLAAGEDITIHRMDIEGGPDCTHPSLEGDEGPISELGRMPRRWRCCECDTVLTEQSDGDT
jgi:hypothetical protein